MKVTRTSGLPIENVAQYKAELDEGAKKIADELGRFEKLTSTVEKGAFLKRWEEMKAEVMARYEFEQEWEFEETIKSKSKLKELVNQYGVIAFARNDEGTLSVFIIDSKF
jgi:hypothetical protein